MNPQFERFDCLGDEHLHRQWIRWSLAHVAPLGPENDEALVPDVER